MASKDLVRRAGNQRTNQNHQNYNVVEVGQNTGKSPGDLKRISVIQTPVKYYQLTLVWKTYKE